MKSITPFLLPRLRATPSLRHFFYDPPHGLCVRLVRPEIPGFREFCALAPKILGKHEIAAGRLEHMLPRTDRLGIADHDRLSCKKGAHDVGDQSVLRPISAADDVACPRRCQRETMPGVFVRIEKGTAIGRGDQLRASLAAVVGIVSS